MASWLFGFCAAAWAMLDSMNPSSETLTPHWVDLSDIPEGGRKTVYWGHLPIYIAHRTPEEIAAGKALDEKYAYWGYIQVGVTEAERLQREQWAVVVGRDFDCQITGQQTDENRGKWGGWYSPCSGRSYDTSGRAHGWYDHFDLWAPPYRFTSDTEIAFPHQLKAP